MHPWCIHRSPTGLTTLEPGEGLLAALGREVEEETSWRLAGTPHLADVADWQSLDADAPARRREFDFLVAVEGDLDQPRLERPKHVEFSWIGADELALLADNRGLDGGLVRRLVQLALRSSHRGKLTAPHATVFLDASAAAGVEPLRAAWDPAMASQIAAHVTVTYPVEIGSLDELAEQARAAAEQVAPFRLRLGGIERCWRPERAIFVEVDDIDRGWQRLHALVLGAAAANLKASPHVTIVHPRTTNRGPAAWERLASQRIDAETTVEQLSITVFDGRRWPVVTTVALQG